MKNTSVIISTYNGERFIFEQLESIVNQTRKVDKIYIFDDLSTDSTVNIINSFFEKNSIAHEVIVNKKNKGWKRNFIDALQYVKEDYIFIADQDDIWIPNKVETMVNVLESNASINVLASNYELLFMENYTNEKCAEEKKLVKDGKLMKVCQVPSEFYVRQPGCSFCVRKAFVDQYIDLWNQEMPHDAFLWKTALLTDSLYSINQPLFKWRRHSTNETKRSIITVNERLKEIQSNIIYLNAINSINICSELACEAYKFFVLRKRMFDNRSFIDWFLIFIKYRNFYVSNRSCFGDLYLLIKQNN